MNKILLKKYIFKTEWKLNANFKMNMITFLPDVHTPENSIPNFFLPIFKRWGNKITVVLPLFYNFRIHFCVDAKLSVGL